MEIADFEKPCKVWSEQGFFVNYKNRSLYSKYNPSKSILTLVNNQNILPGTLVLAISPVLDYGLKELEEKLPKDSFIFAVEMEDSLAQFIKDEETLKSLTKTTLIPKNEAYDFPKIIHQKPWAGRFRRVIRLDFSGGAAFHKEFYDRLQESLVLSIKQYWANRVTIQKFGKKWHKNLFKNLSILEETICIDSFIGKIEKPLVVIGAGKSAVDGIQLIKKHPDDFFILCVDTSFSLLDQNHITPNGIVLEEAQNAIRESFIGADRKNIVVFAGLSSVSHPLKNPNKLCYFATRFAETDFWENLSKQEGFPYEMPPYGSVGLSAVNLALSFRIDNSIPVFLYGLDFSFEAGTTHASGTTAHKRLLRTNKKNRSFENYSCYAPHALSTQDKFGFTTYTLPVLKTYRDLLEGYFSGTENLWDCGKSGLKLGLPLISKEDAEKLCSYGSAKNNTIWKLENTCNSFKDFLENERKALTELRNLLSGETELKGAELSDKIRQLAEKREYLYLHFPDGYRFTMEISFLKRLRAEIDCFLKVLCRN